MLLRIVRMTFVDTDAFLAIFNASKHKIRAFDGCSHLELWQDVEQKNIFTTYSHWISAEALENYRQSDLFKSTWAATKVLFADKPQAFSHQLITQLNQ